MNLPQEIIRKKRDGEILSEEDILFFVSGLTNNIFSDAQIAAMSMAILLNGMNNKETVSLTMAMSKSGDIINWNNLLDSSFICDKHSTGGVGDKVSLLLAPILAACGAYVPMISGRGLGHTGGTLDKFDSIPGYNTQPDLDKFKKIVKEVGCAIIGQTQNLTPADKKLYSIRDIAGTVESAPLITSSIMSKKIASGVKNLVLDIKVGNGSFNPTEEIADKLAKSLVNVAKITGLNCHAILTDMNQILGFNAGHSLEVIESIEFLIGKKTNNRLKEVTFNLSKELLCMNERNLKQDGALKKINEVINNGKAAEKFEIMVNSLGGPKNILSTYEKDLMMASYHEDIFGKSDGYVESINTRELGLILIKIGGGRKQVSDNINYSVGYSNVINIGKKIDNNIPLMTIHTKHKEDVDEIRNKIKNCFVLSDQNTTELKTIYKKII